MLELESIPARPIRGRRVARCGACWLPSALCLCAELPRLANRAQVIVVMHRREAITSTNTGRLAALILDRASVRVHGLAGTSQPETAPRARRLALFPGPGVRVLRPGEALGEPVVLVVPDGTWSQARRLVRRDADLREAEPVTLPPGPPTRYGLRRNPNEEKLCTLEAIARALGVIESPEIETRMLEVFDRFVQRSLIARTGHEVEPPSA